jgi:glucarate dehydratase
MPIQIDKFEFWPILVPDFPLLNMSGLHAPMTPRIITRCTLSDGSEGFGEIPCNTGVIRVMEALLPQLRGVGIDEAAGRLDWVVAESKRLAAEFALADERGSASFDRGVTNHTRAGIQMALYAALAAHRNVPLCDVLGGENGRRRSEVRFNMYLFYLAATEGSGLDYSFLKPREPRGEFEALRAKPLLDADGVVRLALAGLAERMPGVGLVKWKLGVLDPEAELECMIALARAVGPGVQVVPDPNAAWDVETAVGVIRRLKEAIGEQLPYFEDPVAGLDAMAEVHRATGVPLATNMWAPNFAAHEEAARKGAIQITLGGDCHYIGGSDEAVRLSAWCAGNGMGFGQHSNTHLGISNAHTVHMGAAAAVHEWPFDSHYWPWQADYDPTVKWNLELEPGGVCRVPERAGLGIEVDFDGVLGLHEAYLQCNRNGRAYQNRDDGPVAEVVYGGWARPGARAQKWFLAGVR